MQVLLIKLSTGYLMSHQHVNDLYPPPGYQGSLADYVVFLVGKHCGAGVTAVAYGIADAATFVAYLGTNEELAMVKRATITILPNHEVVFL